MAVLIKPIVVLDKSPRLSAFMIPSVPYRTAVDTEYAMTSTAVFVETHGLDMAAICSTVLRLTALDMVLVNKVWGVW